MTTATDTSQIAHDTDATFRAWGLSISNLFAAVGLVQTADTGQVNWTTATKPAVNTTPHYEIWRMNDTQQASAPIFFRIEYGTSNATNRPRMQLQVGTGSDGAGNLINPSTKSVLISATTGTNTTAYTSYAAAGEGYFNCFLKGGSQHNALISICRTCDADSTPNALGWTVYFGGTNAGAGGGPNVAVYDVATGYVTVSTANMACVAPFGITNTLVGTDYQVFLNWSILPRVYPLFASCHVVKAEIGYGTTFTAALVGSTPRTYISGGSAINSSSLCNAGNSAYVLALLYE